MKLKTTFLVLLATIFTFNLSAIELKVQQEYLIETDTYTEDYFFAGNYLEFKGKANDLYAFGEQVDFQGETTLSLFSAGSQVNASGIIGNGIKAAGRDVNFRGISSGTNFMAGENVVLEQESSINGDTFIGGRKVLIKGPVTGDLYAGAGEVYIQNEIKGNVKVYAGQLKIAETGRIIGNLDYHSEHQLSDEEAARVTGQISFEQGEKGVFDDTHSDRFGDGGFWFSLFFKLAFAVFGLLLLLFPVTRVLETPMKRGQVLSHSLWGLLPLFMYPTILVLSMVLVITIPLGLALLLAFVPVLFVTKMMGITIMGGLILQLFNPAIKNRYLFFGIGILLYSVLSFIPIVGFLLMVFVSAIGAGLLLSALIQKRLA